MTILDKILNTKLAEVEERKRMFPVRQVERMPFFSRVPLSMSKSLINGRSGIIAEFKRKSPSKGFINEYADVSEIVAAYAEAGASACSVLTDFSYFGGTLADLTRARETVSLPLLRKDFIVDAYQLFEAKGAGADAVLLIAAALPFKKVQEFTVIAHDLGLEVLLEIHGEEELEYLSCGADIVGVNNRNLATFITDTSVSFGLAEKIPVNRVKISESGLYSAEIMTDLKKVGYHGFLIGDWFMREKLPGEALKKLVGRC